MQSPDLRSASGSWSYVVHPLYQTVSAREEWSSSTALLEGMLLFRLSPYPKEPPTLALTLPPPLEANGNLINGIIMLSADWIEEYGFQGEGNGPPSEADSGSGLGSRSGVFLQQFVMTGGDGQRRYLFCLLLEESLLVTVSVYPLFQLVRDMYTILLDAWSNETKSDSEEDTSDEVGWMLSCLMYATVRPCSGVHYTLRFGEVNEHLPLKVRWGSDPLFVSDSILANALDYLTANVLVAGWTSLLLERRTLIISDAPAILPAVCEIFLALILPLQWPHVCIPVLPTGLNATVESPCPYIIGAPSSVLNEPGIDWGGMTIIHLDHGILKVPVGSETLPKCLEDNLLGRVGRALMTTCQLRFGELQRVKSVPSRSRSNALSYEPVQATLLEAQQDPVSARLCTIREEFANKTLSLLCARYCTLEHFFRSECGLACSLHWQRSSPAGVDVAKLAYSHQKLMRMGRSDNLKLSSREKNSVLYGELSLIEDQPFSPRESVGTSVVPCWVEVDRLGFYIYEYADAPPISWFLNEDITSVAKTCVGSSGAAFEVQVQSKDMFRFCWSSTYERDIWVNAIETEDRGAMNASASLQKRLHPEIRRKSFQNLNVFSVASPESPNVDRTSVSCESDLPSDELNLAGPTRENMELKEEELRVEILKSQCFDGLKAQTQGTNLHQQQSSFAESCNFLGSENILRMLSEQHTSVRTQPEAPISSSLDTGITPPPIAVASDELTLSTLCAELLSFVPWAEHTRTPGIKGVTIATETKTRAEVILARLMGRKDASSEQASISSYLPTPVCSSPLPRGLMDIEAAAGYLSHTFQKTWKLRQHQRIISRTTQASAFNNERSIWNSTSPRSRQVLSSPNSFDDEGYGAMRLQWHHETIDLHFVYSYTPSLESPRRFNRMDTTERFQRAIYGVTDDESAFSFHHFEDNQSALEDHMLDNNSAINAIDCTISPLTPEHERTCSMIHQWLKRAFLMAESKRDRAIEVMRNIQDSIDEQLTDPRMSAAQKMLVGCVSGLLRSKRNSRRAALVDFEDGVFCEDGQVRSCLLSVLGEASTVDSVKQWLQDCSNIGPLVGLHAHELCIRMLYDWVTRRATAVLATRSSKKAKGSRLHQNVRNTVLGAPTTRMRNGRSLWVMKAEVEANSATLNGRAVWSEAPNSALVVVSSLLRRVINLLKPHARRVSLAQSDEEITVMLTPVVLLEVKSSAAFEHFELQTGALQAVDLADLSDEERLVFFLNLHNLVVLHARVARCYAAEGGLKNASFFQFLRDAKYKVCDHTLSVIEIEHAILRAKSSKPGVVGGMLAPRFVDKDPKKVLELSRAHPLVSFGLCLGIRAGPPLCVFTPEGVDAQLKSCTRNVLQKVATVDMKKRTIVLPDVVRIYHRDFGNSQEEMLWNVMSYAPDNLLAQAKDLSQSLATASFTKKIRIRYSQRCSDGATVYAPSTSRGLIEVAVLCVLMLQLVDV